jgi:hypothetical protein
VHTQAVTIGGTMRPAVSDYNNDGTAILLDWIQVSPFASSGTYTSAVYDGGVVKNWGTASWTADVPAGTTLELYQRQSNSATDILNESWTLIPSSGTMIGGTSQYIQYKAELSSNDATLTPVLKDISISCAAAPLITIAGNVWHDVNGMSDGYVNNSALLVQPAPPGLPVGLRAYLVNSATGLVENMSFVNPDGTYSLSDVTPNNVYYIYLSSSQGIIGNPPPALLLPSGWMHTGQKLGTNPGSDGLNDGILIIPASTSNVNNANFGIKIRSGDVVTG